MFARAYDRHAYSHRVRPVYGTAERHLRQAVALSCLEMDGGEKVSFDEFIIKVEVQVLLGCTSPVHTFPFD